MFSFFGDNVTSLTEGEHGTPPLTEYYIIMLSMFAESGILLLIGCL